MDRRPSSHLILGAGCAGLSLCLALLREGVTEPIALVDRRTAFGRDRTWCFWDVGSTPLAALAGHRWERWTIATPAGVTTRGSRRHPYVHVDARDFYTHALREIAGRPNVRLHLGERVFSVRERGAGVEARTSAGTRTAAVAYDALATGSPLARDRPPGAVELAQQFVGQAVRTARPAFDPTTATLMDFRVDQSRGLHFVYVLPFSATEALVEDTYVCAATVPAARRREAIAAYLADRLGVHDFEVTHTERGRIAMTTHRFALGHGRRIHAVGSAAGAVRPSSGYAFVRIQRHCAAVAAAVARGRPVPRRVAPGRYGVLDDVFLRALAAEPAAFPERFRTLLSGTAPDAFARFMSDASGPRDELRVIAALPMGPFAAAALRSLRARRAPRRSAAARPAPAG